MLSHLKRFSLYSCFFFIHLICFWSNHLAIKQSYFMLILIVKLLSHLFFSPPLYLFEFFVIIVNANIFIRYLCFQCVKRFWRYFMNLVTCNYLHTTNDSLISSITFTCVMRNHLSNLLSTILFFIYILENILLHWITCLTQTFAYDNFHLQINFFADFELFWNDPKREISLSNCILLCVLWLFIEKILHFLLWIIAAFIYCADCVHFQ